MATQDRFEEMCWVLVNSEASCAHRFHRQEEQVEEKKQFRKGRRSDRQQCAQEELRRRGSRAEASLSRQCNEAMAVLGLRRHWLRAEVEITGRDGDVQRGTGSMDCGDMKEETGAGSVGCKSGYWSAYVQVTGLAVFMATVVCARYRSYLATRMEVTEEWPGVSFARDDKRRWWKLSAPSSHSPYASGQDVMWMWLICEEIQGEEVPEERQRSLAEEELLQRRLRAKKIDIAREALWQCKDHALLCEQIGAKYLSAYQTAPWLIVEEQQCDEQQSEDEQVEMLEKVKEFPKNACGECDTSHAVLPSMLGSRVWWWSSVEEELTLYSEVSENLAGERSATYREEEFRRTCEDNRLIARLRSVRQRYNALQEERREFEE